MLVWKAISSITFITLEMSLEVAAISSIASRVIFMSWRLLSIISETFSVSLLALSVSLAVDFMRSSISASSLVSSSMVLACSVEPCAIACAVSLT